MSTAFDGLRRVDLPTPVSTRFAAELKQRVAVALGLDDASPSSPPPLSAPDRSTMSAQIVPQTITPYLCVQDGRAALDWYRTYFGAAVSNLFDTAGKVGHAELEFGGAVFYLADEFPEIGVLAPPTIGSGHSHSMVVRVADVDGIVARAVDGGAKATDITEGHGSRSSWVVDPFGHRWNLGTPVVSAADASARRAPSEPYYLTLTSPDVERAAEFYGAVLGWEFSEPFNGGRHVANTAMPIGLRPPTNPFSTTVPGEITMWWTARDFDAAVQRVRDAGGSIESMNTYDSGREAVCLDDQGVEFRLSEPAPGYDVQR
jgi:uncharacterized glyoxalase superfamily protein PhnB